MSMTARINDASGFTGGVNSAFEKTKPPEKKQTLPDKPADYVADDLTRGSKMPRTGADIPKLEFETEPRNQDFEYTPREKQPYSEPAIPAFKPTEFWSNRGTFTSGDGDQVELDNRLRGSKDGKLSAEEIQGIGECKTCANRKYADRSDDSSVSFQTPTKLNPSTAAAKVAAHEHEHVVNERADAEKEGRRIVSQTVSMHYATCPECGSSYISGGKTRTVTAGKQEADENRPGQSGDGSEKIKKDIA